MISLYYIPFPDVTFFTATGKPNFQILTVQLTGMLNGPWPVNALG